MDVSLTAELGRTTGTRPSKRLRREGKIPAVVYGMGTEPTSITVEWPELRRALTTEAGLNALIDLDVAGDASLTVVKDLQRDPVRRSVTHVDFLRIDRNVEMDFDVPLVLVGDLGKLEHEKGMADQLLYSLTVKAKPGSVPTEIEIDGSGLGVGDQLKVSDITLPSGATTDLDPDTVVVNAVITRSGVDADGAEGEGEGESESESEGGESEGDDSDGAEG